MILGLVMYLLVEDTGNIHAQCLDIMINACRVLSIGTGVHDTIVQCRTEDSVTCMQVYTMSTV
jgi:hypothetical protein